MDPFRVRLNCIDSYQASPTKFDPLLRNDVKLSQLHKEPKIPVIRVFGSTETGQKVCAHIHGAFPYLYIEYTGSLSPAEVGAYIHRLHLSIDYALSISYKRDLYDGSAKYVARITLVKGIPFYGFHVGYRYYLKVYALDPKVMNRLADLLRQGVIMKKIFQPLEAHLQYLLQWMADYNLYGCGYINCSKVVFRSPVPQYEELVTPSHLWHDRSIPDSSISEQSELPRVSHCAIEVDICVQDIINRHHIGPRPLHHNFIEYLSPPAPHGKLVRSMESLWREEASRRKSRMPEVKLGSDPFAADMLNSMSAESRISQTTEWIHESEYRDKVMNLIVDERSKSDGEDVSFTTFVKHNPFESTIKTSLEAVEDLFPENLRTSLGLSPETSPGDTDYSISGQEDREVDEKRILTFGLNDPNETIFDSDEDVMQERNQNKDGEYTEGKRLGQADTVQEEFEIDTKSRTADNQPPEQLRSPSDPNVLNPISRSLHADITAIHTVNEHPRSGVLESGHISGTSDLALRRHPPILPYSAPAEKDLKRSDPPENQVHIDSKRQKTTIGKTSTNDILVMNPKSIVDLGGLRHPKNAKFSLGQTELASEIEPGHMSRHAGSSVSFLGANLSKENLFAESSTVPKSSPYHPLKSSVVKDPPVADKVVKLSRKSTSPRMASEKGQAVSFDALADLSSAANNDEHLTSSPSSSTTRLSAAISNVLTNMRRRFDKKASGIVLLAFSEPPPSSTTVTSTMQGFHFPHVIYQDAFYSSEADIPERAREWAGREFKLTSSTAPFLPEFDPTGSLVASFGRNPTVVLDKLKRVERHQYRRHACGLRSWEIASPAPSYNEVQSWLCDKKAPILTDAFERPPSSRSVASYRVKCELSQLDGPTPKNKHGFKYTQMEAISTNPQQEAQYMSTMSLELHVNTRANLVPNPEEDEVQCVFWCLQSDESSEENITTAKGNQIGIIVHSEDGSKAQNVGRHGGIEIQEETSELDLMVRMVEIVRSRDPDILTGFEVHGSSWGYLIERARLRYDYDLVDELSRMKTQSHGRFGKENDRWGFNKTSTIRVTGRHVINIWRAMRSELNLLQYTMENVAFHLLHRRVPHFSWADLTTWYRTGKPHELAKVFTYYISRVQLDLEILEKNELIARTSEQARVLGVDFYSVFSRGSQFKVESLMFRIAKPENFLLVSPSRKQVGGQNALECLPLVMEPQSAFYTSPMLVLDFQSLYPSVMIAYNYCYSTFLGRVVNWRGTNKMGFTEFKRQQRLVELLKDHINIAPNGIMYTKPEIRKSLLARMLSEILETRVMVKSAMKINKDDKALHRLLNNRQLALKLIANVTYGYTSASFSGRMPCSEIADSIVQTGRETLEKAIALIHSVKRWGAEVVYGDTDSLFVYLKGRTKDEAFDIGKEIADTITNMNPHPIKLKFEKVYLPCVLLAKKRYVGYKFENRNQVEPIFDAKGIETVRRDGTPAEQMIEEKALKILFRTSDLSQVKSYFQNQCEKIMKGSVSIQDFCFAREVKLGTYSGNGPPPPGALISTKRMLEDARAEPQYGERVRYVVITGAPGARLIDRCVAPEELLDDDHAELDAEYYISKNLIPPLERIFNLVGANVRSWYDEMPKFQRIRRVGTNFLLHGDSTEPVINKKTLESYMKSSSCLVCSQKVESDGPICTTCLANRALSQLSLRTRLDNAERKFMDFQKLCQSCSGISPLDDVRCDSKDCPVFYTRTKQKARLKTERSIIEPVMRELFGSSVGSKNLEW